MLGVLVAFHRLILSIKRWGDHACQLHSGSGLPSAGRQRAPHTPVREMLLERRVLWSSLGEEMQATLPFSASHHTCLLTSGPRGRPA